MKRFAIEFQPLINEINDSANAVRECADGATMERIKGVYIGYEAGNAFQSERKMRIWYQKANESTQEIRKSLQK